METNPDDRSQVVSDALDAHGHSVVVRDEKYKYITRELSDSANTEVIYTLPDGGFHVLTDRGERHVLEPGEIPQSLCEKAHSITTSPGELDHIEGSFSPKVTRRLEELGYKM
ncbi:hypothetical protein [Halorubrum sp. Atlit-26R]|uniref:hypothetical protein n=1 Tax=Halorubrum sp. Atlit-26R TaxID=2282128 RepID=UPI001F322BBD|nr:hypothetical protein [Halorubrum sp. Atlit-26R]